MHPLKKILSVAIVAQFCFVSAASALTNKEAFLSSLDTLSASVTTSIASQEKSLSDRASGLGSQYDSGILSLGYSLAEVDALTRIPRLSAPNFRQEVSAAYALQKKAIFDNIHTTQTNLSALRDEVSLGYTDLTAAQKQSYDAKLQTFQGQYNSFLTGSTASLDAFSTSFSGRLATVLSSISTMMSSNIDYIRFIASVRQEMASLDIAKANFLSGSTAFETNILPKLQGDISAFAADKKTFTTSIRSNLEDGLTKALQKDRLKAQETNLRAYLEDIMSKWNEYLATSFSQDSTILTQSLENKNLLTVDSALRAGVYDDNGNIRSLDMSGSTVLITNIRKLSSDFSSAAGSVTLLSTTYGSGNTLASVRSDLNAQYRKKLMEYQTLLGTYLTDRLNTALLSEQNHAKNLKLIDAAEALLQKNLESATSAEFAGTLVQAFRAKLDSIALSDGNALDTTAKIRVLKYRYDRIVTQKQIEQSPLMAYFPLRGALDTTFGSFLPTFAAKFSTDVARARLEIVSTKIDTLLASKTLATKQDYQLLVLRVNILKYLEENLK